MVLAMSWVSCSPLAVVPWDGRYKKTKEDSRDLLQQSRKWVAEYGRAKSRDRLTMALARQDDSKGFLERRLIKTNQEKDYVFPKSLATLPREERGKIGVYFVLGFNQDKGRSPPLIREAVRHMTAQGYQAKFIDVASRQTAQNDAKVIAETLAGELPKVDKAMLLGFSRGGTDLVHFWLGPANNLPVDELAKIKIWANFAGVLRGSEVARWGAAGNDPLAWGFRCFLNWREGAPRTTAEDLASIGYDPWFYPHRGFPIVMTKKLTVINFVSIPDGEDGWPVDDKHFKILATTAANQARVVGPCDGLVESAAAILPPRTGLEQWIVRVRGSHSLLGGKYLNGNEVAPCFHQGHQARLKSGNQLLDDFMRALPRSLMK